eukprot:364550-Chlamydomonas_euryale.AAC.13
MSVRRQFRDDPQRVEMPHFCSNPRTGTFKSGPQSMRASSTRHLCSKADPSPSADLSETAASLVRRCCA